MLIAVLGLLCFAGKYLTERIAEQVASSVSMFVLLAPNALDIKYY